MMNTSLTSSKGVNNIDILLGGGYIMDKKMTKVQQICRKVLYSQM